MARLFTSTIEGATALERTGFASASTAPIVGTAPTGGTGILFEKYEARTLSQAVKRIVFAKETGYYVQVPIEITARPSAATDIWYVWNGSANAFKLRLTETGALKVYNSASAELGTIETLAVNTKYIIEVYFKIRANATGELEVRVGGVSKFALARNVNLGETAGEQLQIGHDVTTSVAMRLWVVPDVKVNDSTGVSDNEWPAGGHSSFEAGATLAGTGALASGAHKETKAGAACAGIGALAPAGVHTGLGAATERGIGSLAVLGTSRATFGAAAPRGAGAATGVGPVSRPGAAIAVGAGALVASGHVTHRAAAPLSGAGVLAGTGAAHRNLISGAMPAGVGTLVAVGMRSLITISVLTGRGALAGEGVGTGLGAVALAGIGAAPASGVGTHMGAAALNGVGSLTASSVRERVGAATLRGTGGLVAVPASTSRTGEASLRGVGAMRAELIAYFAEVGKDFPSAWFHLDEFRGTEALDAEGGAAGTYAGEYTLNQAGLIYGNADASAAFRRNAYVRVADRPEVDPADNFTLECWIYPTSYLDASRNGGTFFDKGSGAFIFRFEETGDGTFILRRNEVQTIVASTTRVTLNRRSHVVAKKAGATVRLFLNGRDVTGAVTDSIMVANERPLVIGAADGGVNNFFEGRIDEVAIYETGLDNSRIVAHYNAGKEPVVGEVVLGGVGAVAVEGSVGRLGAIALVGSGTASGGEGFKSGRGAAVVPGTGALAISAFRETGAEGACIGSGALAASGRRDYASSALVNGSGGVSGGAGNKEAKGNARISGMGALASGGSVHSSEGATLAGFGTMSSGPGHRSALTTASFGGLGGLVAAGVVTHKVGVVLAGMGTLASNSTRSTRGLSACSGTGIVRGDGIRATFSALRASGAGLLVAKGAKRLSSGATLAGSSALVAEGIRNPTFPPGYLTLHVARASVYDAPERAELRMEAFV